jgi:hypothetical protein
MNLLRARRIAARILHGNPGVYEVHLCDERGTLTPVGNRHIGDFFEDWNPAIGEIDAPPELLNSGQFVGVVHEHGAYLLEVSP